MFTTDNVIRIVKGLKTQTRRVMNPQPPPNAVMKEHSEVAGYWIPYTADGRLMNSVQGSRKNDCGWYCPYGGAGDQIWVKETYYNFQAGGEAVVYKANLAWEKEERPKPADGWKSAMFMHKRLARIWLTLVEDCRLERVQEITPLDAVKEGCPKYHEYNNKMEYIKSISPIDRFHLLWDSLNTKRGYGWDKNPYVWVITHNAFGVRLE